MKKNKTSKKVKKGPEIIDKKLLKKEIRLAKRDLLVLGFVGVLIVVAVFALSHRPIPIAERGDLVRIHYVASLENGTIVKNQTTRFKVGAGEVIPGIDKAVLGMAVGAKKYVFVPYEEGYGPYDLGKIMSVDKFRTMNRTDTLPYTLLSKTTKEDIEVGREIRTELLPWKILIKNISSENKTIANVTFEHEPVLYSLYYDPLTMTWPVNVTFVNSTKIEIEYLPKIGSVIVGKGGQPGRVVEIRDNKIYIDFNHELAGKNLNIEIEMLEINKTSRD